MNKFFTLIPKIRARLWWEIFNGISKEVYGKETDRLEREGRFNYVRSAIFHLLFHEHYSRDAELGRLITQLKKNHDRLMANPKVGLLMSDKKQEKLKSLMNDILAAGRLEINPSYTEGEVKLFALMCLRGREHFLEQGYDPDEFVDGKCTALATLIAGNFSAYEKTLNHEYVGS